MVKVRMDRDEMDHEDYYECAEPACTNESNNNEVDGAREVVLRDEEEVAGDVEGQNLHGGGFDLGTIQRARRIQLLSQRQRIAQERWSDLSDVAASRRLQNAIMNQVYRDSYGTLEGSDDLAVYDVAAI